MRAGLALLMLVAATGGARAEDACAAGWGAAVGLLGWDEVAALVRPGPDGWCEAFDIAAAKGVDPYTYADIAYRIDVLRWRGEGLERWAAGTGLPQAIEAEMEGFRVAPRLDDSVASWVLGIQAEASAVDGRVDLAWDPATGTLELREARLDYGGGNAGSVSASVAGLDLSSMAALTATLASAGITRLEGEATVDGFFQSNLLMPLATALIDWESEDPAAEAKALRAQGIAAVAAFPEAVFPGGARAAMAEILAALPRPAGSLRVTLAADPPLGPQRFASLAARLEPVTMANLWPTMEGVTVVVEWEPRPPAD